MRKRSTPFVVSLYTEIEIYAPKPRVWQALFQKDRWKHWNTFLYECDSSIPFRQGHKVSLSLRRLPYEEETEFNPLVTRILPDICLSWVSSIPGFRNEYVFELQEIGVGRTKYIHKNYYSGWLTPLFLSFIREDEQRGNQRMARELKRYVERFD